MSKGIYGHVSVVNLFGIKKTAPKGLSWYSVVMVKREFVEEFEYAGVTLRVGQNYNGEWDVTEKFTGLSATRDGELKTWKTKKQAIDKAISNFKKYEAEGTLQEKLANGYHYWLHTRTSMDNMSAIKLKILKKL